MNKWFKEVFINSFSLCKDKRISERQGEIFKRNLELTRETRNSFYFEGELNGCKIILQESFVYGKYKEFFLTYHIDKSEEIKEHRRKIHEFGSYIDSLIGKVPDEEIDKLEEQWKRMCEENEEIIKSQYISA